METPRAQRELAPGRQVPGHRPNVVVFVIDTLRLDFTGAGTAPGRTTVLGRELRSRHPRATVLEAATAAATSTVPSVKGLMTSRPPSTWGFTGAGSDPPPEGVPTLASSFLRAGYDTAAVTGNPLIQGGAFESGFTYFWAAGGLHFFQGSLLLQDLLALRDYWQTLELVSRFRIHKLDGESVLRVADRWLSERAPDRPFFLYLHIVEPHWPYDAAGPDPPIELPGPPLDHVDLLRLPKGFPRNRIIRGTALLQELEQRYETGVRRAGDLVGRTLSMLENAGTADDTLVIVLADHGEEFFEHDGFSHGHDVFEEQTAVPFVLLWPPNWPEWRPVSESSAPVSLLDLWPTLADLVDLPTPEAGLSGRSLVPLLAGEEDPSASEPVMSEAFYGPFWRMSFRQGRFKVRLTFNTEVSPLDTAAVEVFDLVADPGEESPIRPGDDELRTSSPVRAQRRRAAGAIGRRTVCPEPPLTTPSSSSFGRSATSSKLPVAAARSSTLLGFSRPTLERPATA
ncbi:MAG: sulfatase-like hydrolase/transferase [Thermoanaerobaculia bacterium]